ncbi:hypothetical protein NPIL_516591, partial [Nephila pilipes]
MEQPFSREALSNIEFLLSSFSTHLLGTVFQRRGVLFELTPHCDFGVCSGFSVYTREFDVTQL